MINYESILSAFDGKPTLLQWLKMVKKALDESILKNINITQNGQKVVFTFNFEDGTSISAPEVTLPKGDKGEKGKDGVGIVNMETTNSQVVGVNTESTIRVELSDGSTKQFKAYAKNGSNGTDGVSITGIDTVGNQVVGDETLTTLRANYSNDTTGEFVVTAKNGKDASKSGSMYLHSVEMIAGNSIITFNLYSTFRRVNYADALAQIPSFYQIPACILDGDKSGVVSLKKEGSNTIKVYGLIYDKVTSTTEFYENTASISDSSFNDILLGENL